MSQLRLHTVDGVVLVQLLLGTLGLGPFLLATGTHALVYDHLFNYSMLLFRLLLRLLDLGGLEATWSRLRLQALLGGRRGTWF